MRKSIFLICTSLLIISAAHAAPIGVKEKSPPQYEVTAPATLFVDEVFTITLQEVQLPLINLSAEDMAGVEITQEYASHITDVDINPLYRIRHISGTDKTKYSLINEGRLEGYVKLYDKPDPVPNK